MTFWIAVKHTDMVLMIADSAVTRIGGAQPDRKRTSIGELNVWESGEKKAVSEGSVKISELGDSLFVYSGSALLGNAVGATYLELQRTSDDPVDCLRCALQMHSGPTAGGFAECGVARHTGSGFVLAVGDTANPRGVRTVSRYTSGSAPDLLSGQLVRALSSLEQINLLPRERLMFGTAVLQSLGIHYYLMEQGVGGVYQGLGLDASGIIQCPDAWYVPLTDLGTFPLEDSCAVFHRPGMVITRPGRDEGYHKHILVNHHFWNSVNQSYLDVIGFDKIFAWDVEYFITINADRHSVVVFENNAELTRNSIGMREGGIIRMTIDTKLVETVLADDMKDRGRMILAHFIKPHQPSGYLKQGLTIPLQ